MSGLRTRGAPLSERRRETMKGCVVWCALALAIPAAARAAGPGDADEAAIRAEFERQVDIYIRTTQKDLILDPQYPNVSVSILDAGVTTKDSLITPYVGKVKYLVEYDDTAVKGSRKSHPYLMQCTYFDGRWDIDPHGHKARKNLTDLDKKKTKMLFPDE
jgi:hypothetical protein